MAFDQLLPEVVKAVDSDDLNTFNRRGTFEPITAPKQEQQMRADALELLQQVVKTEWLPPATLVTPGLRNFMTARPSYRVTHSAFEKGGVRGLYHWSENTDFWLYLEQSPSAPPLKVSDVVRAEVLAPTSPDRPALAARDFLRERAFLPKGPFESVRILLLRVRLPQSLTVANFGYPGQVKP